MTPPTGAGQNRRFPADQFTEVVVYAGILRATADLIKLLHAFLTDAGPAVHTQLGQFLITRQAGVNATNPATEAAIQMHELTEAADLLHDLANPYAEDVASESNVTSATDR